MLAHFEMDCGDRRRLLLRGVLADAAIPSTSRIHLWNPRWPPHAKFHNGQTMMMASFRHTLADPAVRRASAQDAMVSRHYGGRLALLAWAGTGRGSMLPLLHRPDLCSSFRPGRRRRLPSGPSPSFHCRRVPKFERGR